VSGFQNDGEFPKSAAWVLNAEGVRSAYREKRKREKDGDGGDDDGKRKKKKRKAADGQEALRAKANLMIKPGESLKHFNRRVEDDMRPLVRTAMSLTVSTSKQKRKASEREEQSNTPGKSSEKKKSSGLPESKPQAIEPPAKQRDFDRLASSAPKRLNDIAQAPPQLSIGSRLKSKVNGSPNSSGLKCDNVVSDAQKRMMDLEREKAIARYRALKSAKEAT